MNIPKKISAIKSSILLKVGFVASLFYLSFGGTCICCGTPLTACPVGITSAGVAGIVSSSFFHMIGRMAKMITALKKFNPFSKKTPN